MMDPRTAASISPPVFFIRADGRFQKIITTEICFLESRRNYVRVVTRSGEYLTLGTLKQFLEVLPACRFVRIHRAYVVHLDWVQSFDRTAVYGADLTLPIGESYAQALPGHLTIVTGAPPKLFATSIPDR